MGGVEDGLAQLQRMQKRALRVGLDIHHYIPTILLHQQSDVPNLLTRWLCNLKKEMFKQKENAELIKIPVRNNTLNDATVFETVRQNIEKYKCNPLYRGAILWNSMAVETRSYADYPGFK